MKTNRIFLTFLVALFTTVAFSQIATSVHNFSGWAVNGGGEQSLCDACHTPHQVATITGAPLWNHNASLSTTFDNYDVAHSATMDATTGNPSGTSLLCLSCHDGTTALDAYGGAAGGAQTMPASGLVGTASAGNLDLTTEHPISFSYASAVTNGDTGLVLEATVALTGIIPGGMVECSSCHDVHDQGAGTYALLTIDNDLSGLCTTCHVK